MMKRWLVFLLLFPFSCIAQEENYLLWKVSSPSGTHVSYLFGTIHSNDSLVNSFGNEWQNAWNACEVIAVEVSIFEAGDMQESLDAMMMKDSLLSDLCTPAEMTEIQSYLSDRIPTIPMSMLVKFKPFFILALLMEMPDSGQPQQMVMDFHLQFMANERGMRVQGLEKPEEQAESVNAISLQDQMKMLLDYIRAGGAKNEMKEMLELYRAQNLQKLAESMMDEQIPAAINESLLIARNKRFADRLLPIILSEDVFCAVGALHLPGEDGLIALLRKEGFRVEPLPFTFIDRH